MTTVIDNWKRTYVSRLVFDRSHVRRRYGIRVGMEIVASAIKDHRKLVAELSALYRVCPVARIASADKISFFSPPLLPSPPPSAIPSFSPSFLLHVPYSQAKERRLHRKGQTLWPLDEVWAVPFSLLLLQSPTFLFHPSGLLTLRLKKLVLGFSIVSFPTFQWRNGASFIQRRKRSYTRSG